jgi:hypothetical protein
MVVEVVSQHGNLGEGVCGRVAKHEPGPALCGTGLLHQSTRAGQPLVVLTLSTFCGHTTKLCWLLIPWGHAKRKNTTNRRGRYPLFHGSPPVPDFCAVFLLSMVVEIRVIGAVSSSQ